MLACTRLAVRCDRLKKEVCCSLPLFRREVKIAATELKTGRAIWFRDKLCTVISVSRVGQGRGAMALKVDLKELIGTWKGSMRLTNSENFEAPELISRKVSFLYKTEEDYVFLDDVTHEELVLKRNNISYTNDDLRLLTEGVHVQLKICDGIPISMQFYPQLFHKVKIEETSANVVASGGTGTSYKNAFINGIAVTVPGFIKDGETCMFELDVNLRPTYISRVESK